MSAGRNIMCERTLYELPRFHLNFLSPILRGNLLQLRLIKGTNEFKQYYLGHHTSPKTLMKELQINLF